MKLLLWGAGAQGRTTHDLAQACGFTDIVFVDDKPSGNLVRGSPVFSPEDERTLGYKRFLVSIGDNINRARLYNQVRSRGLEPALLIHPSAVVSPSAGIGRGSIVMPQVVVGADVSIGEDCILNTSCIVEHGSAVGDHVHISPTVVIGGDVKIGAFAHAGMGAVVLSGLSIGRGSLLGAGAVVIGDVDPEWIVSGVPAKPRRLNVHA